jgi:Domain of unknown function (DUF6378)
MRDKVEEILEKRQDDYGDAEEAFTAIGRIWGAFLKIDDIPAHEVALLMDALKSVRLFNNPSHEDSFNDKYGYLHHYREIVDRGFRE